MSMTPYVGFKPDVDPTTPGVITACTDLLPTLKGFKARPSASASGYAALAAACTGAAVILKLDGTSRMFAGTGTKLYEGSNLAWTDRSRGGNYSATINWRFTQFGNSTLATNKTDVLQVSTTGAFADISGAPKASTMDAAAGFVMLGATNDGTYGDQTDRWWCSAYQDATSGTAWTPDVTTQCTTGRLIDAPGGINCIKALGSNFVAYKAKSMFLGSYVGAPSVFSWVQIPGEIGTNSQESVVSIGTSHLFIGNDNIWMFDGSRPVPIGSDINQWFFARLNKAYRHLIRGLHEKEATRVWFFYPSENSVTNDSAIIYNYTTDRWGTATLTTEIPLEYLNGTITFASMGTLFSTFADIVAVPFDSDYWMQAAAVPAYFDSAHTLQLLIGTSSGCSITTGDIGDDTQLSLATRVRPRFLTSPTTGTMVNYFRDNLGDDATEGESATLDSGKFDVLCSARWHHFKYTYTGDVEVVGDAVSLVPDGFA